MKKIKLFILCLFISAMCFCQGINKVYRSSYSKFDGQRWVEKRVMYPEFLYITIKDNDIRINNESNRHFVYFGEPEKNDYDTHSCFTWNCIDDDGKSCLFMLKRYRKDDTMVMSFVYSSESVMFEYVIENK